MTPPKPSRATSPEGHPGLLAELRRRVEARGPIPFAEFMELALYHPDGGYYARAEDPIGRKQESDFYTAPSRHPAFGALLGAQVAECLAHVGGSSLDLVEFGPGDGNLMVSLLRELERSAPDVARRLHCTLVETNPHRRESQRRRLEEAGWGTRTRWVAPSQWEASVGFLRGVILANEMLDALPVHRLIYRGDEFQEVHVGWKDGPVEVLLPPSTPTLLAELSRYPISPREGQEVEVGLEALEWIERVGLRLGRGYCLIADYGYLAPEMFGPRHHRGTLLAYHRHQTNERYLERIGEQDLTAHVNYSSVLQAAAGAGLVARGPVPQGRFLVALGILRRFAGAGDAPEGQALRERQSIKDLFIPGGMGESHQILVLATPGLEMDLKGLRAPERWEVPESEGETKFADSLRGV